MVARSLSGAPRAGAGPERRPRRLRKLRATRQRHGRAGSRAAGPERRPRRPREPRAAGAGARRPRRPRELRAAAGRHPHPQARAVAARRAGRGLGARAAHAPPEGQGPPQEVQVLAAHRRCERLRPRRRGNYDSGRRRGRLRPHRLGDLRPRRRGARRPFRGAAQLTNGGLGPAAAGFNGEGRRR